jgi:hypothetical protein
MSGHAPRVRVTIERLVLRGVPHGQEAAVVVALERRLALLATGAGGDAATLRARGGTTVPVARPRPSRTAARDARTLGEAAAGAIWASVGGRR